MIVSVTEVKVCGGEKDGTRKVIWSLKGLRRTDMILKDFQKEQRGQLLENHRSFSVMFPGKVVVWTIKEVACAPRRISRKFQDLGLRKIAFSSSKGYCELD